jgi:hypothetical protein
MERTDPEHGERRYTAEELAGHSWTFSETLEHVRARDLGRDSPRALRRA